MIGEKRGLDRPVGLAPAVVVELDPARPAVDHDDEVAVVEREVGDVLVGVAVVVVVPDRLADRGQHLRLGDDDRPLAEAIALLDRLLVVDVAGGPEHAGEHRREYGLDALARDRERLDPVVVLERERGLAAVGRDVEPSCVVGVLVDRLATEEPGGVVDERPRRRDVDPVLATDVHACHPPLVPEALADDTRDVHATTV